MRQPTPEECSMDHIRQLLLIRFGRPEYVIVAVSCGPAGTLYKFLMGQATKRTSEGLLHIFIVQALLEEGKRVPQPRGKRLVLAGRGSITAGASPGTRPECLPGKSDQQTL